ncbi:hypothetical protein CEXT_726461 [Caerostris extrusa]|uniref:Uncharacterized protein n=1 Tax=Caerostris extrusa TaxID=172846 RepID=A0AAV4SR69_CAEEX|nr:hypothetical protein CEXT_726461 [Caerostris extrusa]
MRSPHSRRSRSSEAGSSSPVMPPPPLQAENPVDDSDMSSDLNLPPSSPPEDFGASSPPEPNSNAGIFSDLEMSSPLCYELLVLTVLQAVQLGMFLLFHVM